MIEDHHLEIVNDTYKNQATGKLEINRDYRTKGIVTYKLNL